MANKEKPVLTHFDERGNGYSDWIIGVYACDTCPYRVVRYCRNEYTPHGWWETVKEIGENEDIFDIDAPLYYFDIQDDTLKEETC